MKGKLLGFLIVLASFPDILARFQADPDAVAKQYGLTDDQLAAIKSNDYRKVEAALRAENRGIISDIKFGSHFKAVDINDVSAFLTPLDLDDSGKSDAGDSDDDDDT